MSAWKGPKIDQNSRHLAKLLFESPQYAINLQGMVQKLIRFRYYILFGAFLLWMVFFDNNNLFYRISIAKEISAMEEMKTFHQKELVKLNQQKTELLGNAHHLEKFAREKYRMKRDNEDLFILVRDSSEKD
jgi:cell division protein FtsB